MEKCYKFIVWGILFFVGNLIAEDIDYWIMFRHDPQHTGRSPYPGPNKCLEKWSYAVQEKDALFKSSPVIKGLDSEPDPEHHPMLYIGNYQHGCVYAFKDTHWYVNSNVYAEALLKWSTKIDTASLPTGTSSTPALGAVGSVAEGELYIGSNSSHSLIALYYRDGSFKWSSGYETGDDVISSPVISNAGVIYFGSEDGNLYAVNRDKTLKWKFETGDKITASPALSHDQTVVYIHSQDDSLYAINAETGARIWAYYIPVTINHASPSVGGDGTIYQGGTGAIFAINPDGTEKGKFTINTSSTFGSIAISADDSTIYTFALNKVYAINTNDMTEKWVTLLPYGAVSVKYGGPILSSNGYLYIGTGWIAGGDGLGMLYCLDVTDGEIVCKYQTEDELWNTPAIGPDSTVYFGDCSGARIYAIWNDSISREEVEEQESKIIEELEKTSYPIPFSKSTTIYFYVNEEAKVSVEICDLSGRVVRKLLNTYLPVGKYEISWNGKDDRGILLPNGIYFCKLEVGKKKVFQKLLFICPKR
jgi:outer membrane protein assembly factor BamB